MTELAKQFVEQRQNERFDLGEEAILHTQRFHRSVLIENISVKGMKIISPEGSIPLEMQLQMNQDMAIELLSGEKIFGSIVWSIRNTAGVFFDKAIGEDHHLMLKARAMKKG